jgi:hypothetical protein
MSAPKYARLRAYLAGLEGDPATLTFETIEEIVGGELPDAARENEDWWTNEPGQIVQRQTEGWLDAGYIVVDVDLERGVARFVED